MKILQINSFYKFGSTGRIVYDLTKVLKNKSIDSYVAYGWGMEKNENIFPINKKLNVVISIVLSRITGRSGAFNFFATKRLCRWILRIKPDIIHLHNIHGFYINIKVLFNFLKKYDVPVIWTLHDCWAFTGHCAYFDAVSCNKWVKECFCCIQKREYPFAFIDCSQKNYANKKSLFNSINKMHIVTPSKWLQENVRKSFLKHYDLNVIYNGIDLKKFKPVKSHIKEKYKIGGEKIILGIAPDLNGRKGGKYFLELSQIIATDVVIVILSLNASQKLPDNIFVLPHTNNIDELVELYSGADVFVNPTLEDNFPTVNIEALACGTPVIAFDTGGCKEIIDHTCGEIVPKGEVQQLLAAINRCWKNKKISEQCVKRASHYDKAKKFQEYIDLYFARLEE